MTSALHIFKDFKVPSHFPGGFPDPVPRSPTSSSCPAWKSGTPWLSAKMAFSSSATKLVDDISRISGPRPFLITYDLSLQCHDLTYLVSDLLSDQVLAIFDQDVRWCKSIDKATARRQCRASWLAADLQRCWLTVASSKRCLGNGGFGAKVRESNINDSNTQQSKRRFQRKTQVVRRSKMAVSLGWQARLMRRVVLLEDRRKPVSLERYTYQQVNAWNLCVELGLYPCYTMLYHFYYLPMDSDGLAWRFAASTGMQVQTHRCDWMVSSAKHICPPKKSILTYLNFLVITSPLIARLPAAHSSVSWQNQFSLS